MSQKMLGVVLWSDQAAHKAVIWCEDHGELAFWHEPENGAHEGAALDAGDLVEFDMHDGENLRHASNPQRLEEKQFSGLVETLCSATGAPARGLAVPGVAGRVIAFPDPQRAERHVA
ncbi:cold shock domain-containing protein [Salipiger pacificus]|uniref:Uncharacterized protein n=1 Tax=Alloyangia mangrovi TaxID=1779329 RepID=A0A2A3JQC2_9RHOB|nr:cold shock domain-containing protein [Alloyangia pacifica]MCA0946041.1 cold shock domain-containing protein [Alloyangia pacifica]